MKEQILQLRQEGKTYSEIQKILGCSRGTISYHCGKDQKEKTIDRNSKRKEKLKSSKEGSLIISLEKLFSRKVHDNLKFNQLLMSDNYAYDKKDRDLWIKKRIENPICYLTKKSIDLFDRSSYEIDHIIPLSKGGTNDYNNIDICLRDINRMKSDLSLEQLYNYCELLLNNKGD